MKRLRKYKNLKKLNKYLLGEKSKSMPLFNSLIGSRAEGLNLDIGKPFFAPRNPLRSIYALKTLYMRYRTVFDYLDIHKPKSILEIGCFWVYVYPNSLIQLYTAYIRSLRHILNAKGFLEKKMIY